MAVINARHWLLRPKISSSPTLKPRPTAIGKPPAKRSAPAPLVDGRERLIVYVDRTMLEVFSSDGLTDVPLPFISKSAGQSVSVSDTDAKGGKAKLTSLQVFLPTQ